jgi:hypothetical protein
MNNKTSYYSTAKSLLKKWQDKNLLSHTTNSSKVKTITNISKTIVDKKTSVKRKSADDDVATYSSTLRFEIRIIRNELISYLILLVNLNHLMNIKMVIKINHHHQLKNAKFFHLLNMSEVKNQQLLHHQQLIQRIIN